MYGLENNRLRAQESKETLVQDFLAKLEIHRRKHAGIVRKYANKGGSQKALRRLRVPKSFELEMQEG